MTGHVDSGDFGLLSPQWAGSDVASATSDAAVLLAILDVEVALVEAWQGLGLAPENAAATVRSALDGAGIEGPGIDVSALAAQSRAGGNPIIPLVKRLREAVAKGDEKVATWVHRGATSQDVLDTALMLVAHRTLALIEADLEAVATSLAALAESHRSTLMVSRTLTQHGVPSTFGLKAAGWLDGVVAAAVRLREARAGLPVQWGGAGGTLASFAVIAGPGTGLRIADALADSLGLAPSTPWQTQRAPVTILGDALAQASGALGKIAVDVLASARPELGELGEPSEAGRGGSSAMPQKQNPVLSVLIHSSAQRAPGLAAELHRSAVAVDERPDGAWHSEWSALRELLRFVGGASELAAELAAGLVVHPEAMRRNLELSGPLVVGERLMIELAPLLGRERLQELVSAVVADPERDLFGLLRAEPALAELGEGRLAAMLDPAGYVGESDAIIDRVLARHAEFAAREGQ
ncbi:3-carboxy-cis,cis-muconate cycloisomerase [Homoserinimonas aerilata]|uniref:3-carboxy-cis,cis-muconate cycloisomerase n=1 Tax=Homoserinimonas aerilata TaxID=1162970 RepID=A0A542YK72_9MICO|nr:adenylosuccinate lyase family protein [Homoserinimonas aerilata]TQL48503.1 3-carboxy-cis,cis-muconate cycloisomerase [Homoserinimonas aerilata]